jgi:hypothetical protein
MSHKQMPRLGSAIASTILSLFSGVLVVGVDNAQAAVLNYKFQAEYRASGFFKFNDSSLTGIGSEQIAVSEGRLNAATASNSNYGLKGKDYYDLAGAIVSIYQGKLVGLQASGGDTAIREINISPDEPGGPYYIKYESSASWWIDTNGLSSFFWGLSYVTISDRDRTLIIDRSGLGNNYTNVSYTLAEPVPEPLTAGGTALALAGLSWLKHKKKMAA